MRQKAPPQVVYSVRLPQELDDAMEKVCARRKGVNKKQIIEAALQEYFFPKGADQKELVYSRFLDRLDRRLKRNERNLEILAETLSLYIRVWLTNTMEIPEEQKAEAKRIGGKRYHNFVEILGKRLQEGKTFFAELPEERLLKPEAFFSGTDEKERKGEEELL